MAESEDRLVPPCDPDGMWCGFPLTAFYFTTQWLSIRNSILTTPKWLNSSTALHEEHYKHLLLSSSGFFSLTFSSWILCFPSCRKTMIQSQIIPDLTCDSISFLHNVSAGGERVLSLPPPSSLSLPPSLSVFDGKTEPRVPRMPGKCSTKPCLQVVLLFNF